jgi:outer membrane protein assembly factor BamA
MRSDDGSLKEENPLARWSNLLNDAIFASGRAAPNEELLRQRLEEAGYVDVQSFTLRVPMGPWAKDKYEHY